MHFTAIALVALGSVAFARIAFRIAREVRMRGREATSEELVQAALGDMDRAVLALDARRFFIASEAALLQRLGPVVGLRPAAIQVKTLGELLPEDCRGVRPVLHTADAVIHGWRRVSRAELLGWRARVLRELQVLELERTERLRAANEEVQGQLALAVGLLFAAAGAFSLGMALEAEPTAATLVESAAIERPAHEESSIHLPLHTDASPGSEGTLVSFPRRDDPLPPHTWENRGEDGDVLFPREAHLPLKQTGRLQDR